MREIDLFTEEDKIEITKERMDQADNYLYYSNENKNATTQRCVELLLKQDYNYDGWYHYSKNYETKGVKVWFFNPKWRVKQ